MSIREFVYTTDVLDRYFSKSELQGIFGLTATGIDILNNIVRDVVTVENREDDKYISVRDFEFLLYVMYLSGHVEYRLNRYGRMSSGPEGSISEYSERGVRGVDIVRGILDFNKSGISRLAVNALSSALKSAFEYGSCDGIAPIQNVWLRPCLAEMMEDMREDYSNILKIPIDLPVMGYFDFIRIRARTKGLTSEIKPALYGNTDSLQRLESGLELKFYLPKTEWLTLKLERIYHVNGR